MLDPCVTKRSWRRWACFSIAQTCLQTMSQSGSRRRKIAVVLRSTCVYGKEKGWIVLWMRSLVHGTFWWKYSTWNVFFLTPALVFRVVEAFRVKWKIFTAFSPMQRSFFTTKTIILCNKLWIWLVNKMRENVFLLSIISFKLHHKTDWFCVAYLHHSTWNTILQVETRLKMQALTCTVLFYFILNIHKYAQENWLIISLAPFFLYFAIIINP